MTLGPVKTRAVPHSLDISEEAGVRFLHFGSDWVQGAMRIRKPDALEIEYTREMLACLSVERLDAVAARILLIGLGAGVARQVPDRRLPHAKLHGRRDRSADPGFRARAISRLPDDPARIDIEIGDGVRFVASRSETFDLILVDGFDHRARAGDARDRRRSIATAARGLRPGGIMATNLFGNAARIRASGCDRDRRALSTSRVVCLPPGEVGNVDRVRAGERSEGEMTLDDLRQRARVLRDELGLNLKPLLKRIVASGMLPGGVLVA